MSTLLKKILLSFLSFFILFFSVAPNFAIAKAQDATWYSQGFFDWYSKVNDTSNPSEIFGERYTAAQVQWVFYGLLSLPLNALPPSMKNVVNNCLISSMSGGGINLVTCTTSVSSFLTEVINTFGFNSLITESSDNKTNIAQEVFNTENRSISGIRYVQSMTNRLSLVKEVHAQGYGYSALDTIQKYWSGFRNMAYAIVVLITIIFAFLIMFKVKLNPQTVITVQSALPKIFLAILLATFSYAIAGFLIDMMYVVAGLMASLMKAAGFADSTTLAYEWISQSGKVPALFGGLWILVLMFGYWILFLVGIFLSLVGTLLHLSIYGVILSILFLLVWIWLLLLVGWYTIKVPWVLIKNLISLYLSIVIAPLQIIAGTLIPSLGFTQWLKKVIAELLVFPVTGLFIYLAYKTMFSSYAASFEGLGLNINIMGSTSPGKLWAPEIVTSAGSMQGLLWMMISFSFIILIPKTVDIMKAAIMGEKFSFGSAVNEAMGPIDWAKGKVTRSPAYRSLEEYGGIRSAAALLESQLARDLAGSRAARLVNRIAGTDLENTRGKLASDMRTKASP